MQQHCLFGFLIVFLLIQSVAPKTFKLSPYLVLTTTITSDEITCSAILDLSALSPPSGDNSGWLGIGWHELGDDMDGMMITDVNIAIFDTNGKGTVNDYYCYSHSLPPDDVSLGGKDDILSSSIKMLGNITSVTFSRKLDTKDQYDFPVQPGPMRLVWAAGIGPIGYHGPFKGQLVVDFFDDYCGNQDSCEGCVKAPASSKCSYCATDNLCYNAGNTGQCTTFNSTCSKTAPLAGCPAAVTPLPNAWTPPNFCASVWATSVGSPRGILTTSNGDLLIVDASGNRILVLWDENKDGKSDASERAVLATAPRINHGIKIFRDYLYASNPTTVYRWRYTAGQRTNLGNPEEVVVNVPCCHHTTRTIAFDQNGFLFVSVGSASNVDPNSTHANIHRFNVGENPTLPIDWDDGYLFADGLRNEVGINFDREGRLWGVENGCDNLARPDLGGDIHNDNPSEEVNLFADPGKFYGYPYCWSEYRLANGVGGGAGTQWLHPQFDNDGEHTDAWCKSTTNVVKPVWNMAAHQAPLDINFYYGTSFPGSYFGGAFVSLHGSWNRNPPQGYRVNFLAFQNGLPVSENVLLRYNGATESWTVRPVGLSNGPCSDGESDKNDCLFVSSDSTGQIIKIGYYP